MNDINNPYSQKKTESELEKQARLRQLASKLSQNPNQSTGSFVRSPQISSTEGRQPSKISPESLVTKPDKSVIKRPVFIPTAPVLRAKKSSRWLWFMVTGLVIILLGATGYLFIAYNNQLKINSESVEIETTATTNTQSSLTTNKDLLEKIGLLIALPTDEEPTIATVSDLTKLQGEPFFAKAQVGDKVLIYEKAQKAILYRPETNQVIELAPLFGQSEEVPPPTTITE